MKRQQIVLIACGSVFGLVCLGVGWFLFSAMSAKNAAADSRNSAYDNLKSIYNAKVFPSKENIARIKTDEKTLEAWLNSASNIIHKGDLQIDKESPTGFKQLLQSTVRSLSAHSGSVSGKIVANGFNFGFDKYLGESDSLPAPEHVDRLARQLKIIELVCKELYGAQILSLDKVDRETFDGAQPGESKTNRSEDMGKKRKNKRNADGASHNRSGALNEMPSEGPSHSAGLFSKQRFVFGFKARPEAFIDVLNRLAAMDLFVVVSDVSFQKTDDLLTKHEAKKTDSKKKSATSPLGEATAVDPASIPHTDRIVTDPELEAPVSVELAIDVYSFEGV